MDSMQIGFMANLVRLIAVRRHPRRRRSRGKIKEIAAKPKYADVPACAARTIKERSARLVSQSRYVGVAAGEAVSDEDFKEQLETLNEKLETLTAARV